MRVLLLATTILANSVAVGNAQPGRRVQQAQPAIGWCEIELAACYLMCAYTGGTQNCYDGCHELYNICKQM